MLKRFKSALLNAVGANEQNLPYPIDFDDDLVPKYNNSDFNQEIENKPYSRPSFLGLTAEETQVRALEYGAYYSETPLLLTISNEFNFIYNW